MKWLILFSLGLVYLSQLGSYPLLEPDEGRYGEIAREMAESDGDWGVPHLNGIPHFQKPPVFYWLTACSIRVFGATEFAVRLPVALSALGTLLLTWCIARRLHGERASWIAVAILGSMPLFLALGRTATPDMTMTLWITAAIYCLIRSEERRRWGWLFFVCAGIGFLTKGPVALLVPFLTALGIRDLREKVPWAGGVAVSLLIGLSWFLVMSFRFPELRDYFVHEELIARFTSSDHGRSRPMWFFLPVLLAGCLPWTLLVGKPAKEERALFVGWVVVPLVALSLSGSKLPTYVLPLLPGIAVALCGTIARRPPLRNGRAAAVLIFLIAAAAMPPVLAKLAVTPIPFGLMGYTIFLWILGLVWFATLQRSLLFVATLAAASLLPLPASLVHWNDLLAQQASVRPLAERILASERGGAPSRVVSCGIRAHGLAFYLGRSVDITRSDADLPRVAETSALHRSIETSLHLGPKAVSRLIPEPGVSLFVVTRIGRYKKDFEGPDWRPLQTAGDFILLERRATVTPPQRRNAIETTTSG